MQDGLEQSYFILQTGNFREVDLPIPSSLEFMKL